MRELAQLGRIKLRIAVIAARQFMQGSRLRVGVVSGTAVVFWALMFWMFLSGFTFLRDFQGITDSIKHTLMQYLFAFFFLALLVMMTISSGVICYTSFYRNDEASFLMSLPLNAGTVFTYKAAESVLFSSWGLIVLVVPMIVAYGVAFEAQAAFYLISLVFCVLFIGIPMALGAMAALLLPLVIPRRRRTTLIIIAGAATVLLAVWGLSLLGKQASNVFTEVGLKRVTDHIAFSQHWALPSYWVSDGILSAVHLGAHDTPEALSDLRHSGFRALFMLANVLFLGMVACRSGALLYPLAWAKAHAGSSRRGNPRPRRAVHTVLNGLLLFLPAELRRLIVKDVITFLRDPAQWSQCALFFGLLGFYILNMPRFGIGALQPYWHSLVSLLNLGVTCLTLSTFTSRFVFPQLSLEGRRIWIIGLMPMRRRTILWGKFLFAAIGSMLISETLIITSDIMLRMPGWIMVVHAIVTACACCGLSGLAVGLGACYPHMRSDNPSKIVSSFGGTLNLVCSIFFVVASVMLVAVPLHKQALAPAGDATWLRWMAVCVALDIVLAAIVCLAPMLAGARAFERMEF